MWMSGQRPVSIVLHVKDLKHCINTPGAIDVLISAVDAEQPANVDMFFSISVNHKEPEVTGAD